MPAKNPNPVVFAQTIIHELAQIRATVSHLSEVFLDDVANRHNLSDSDKAALRGEFKAHVNTKARRFFELYVREVGVEIKHKQDGQDEAKKPSP